MRVLVEQTHKVAEALSAKMPTEQRPAVHLVMGGEDDGEWFLHPERPAIIIGTQDMLLSRSLNRGYASSRARWPVEYGLLNHDALWVMDEVQLMDVGLATSAQLQAFRDQDEAKHLRPCSTWWMSATLQSRWLKSIDTAPAHDEWIRDPCVVTPQQRDNGLWKIRKSLVIDSIDGTDATKFAKRILEEHRKTLSGDYGRITLVVCNTVDRACATFDKLRAEADATELELVHSRFRPHERQAWRERFLSRQSCSPHADRIIVATQVVEAGVDISAGCLVTELAPWPSLVQRFGRCARYGEQGRVIVIERGREEAQAAPYLPEELESAWDALQELKDVGIASLEKYEEALSESARARLYPYAPAHLLLRREFEELFDTTPDLTGADLDISRFIRTGDERDVQVFWLDIEKTERPVAQRRPQRQELCAVPFLKARDWLCGAETKTNRKPKLRKGYRAWVWDFIDGKWADADRASLLPGRVVCVAATCGGYQEQRGFDPDSNVPVSPVPLLPTPPEELALDQADAQNDSDALSFSGWKTIACHSKEVVEAVQEIARELQLPSTLRELLMLAAQWHDWGKAHPAFQNMLLRQRESAMTLPGHAWAKSDQRPTGRARYFADDRARDERCGFRHELASALALFAVLEAFAPHHPALLGPWRDAFAAQGLAMPAQAAASPPAIVQPILACSAESFDLLVYLVASHHGKVRAAMHASPKDQDYRDADQRGLPIRGICEGDCLPPVVCDAQGGMTPAVCLTLQPSYLGLSPRTGASWRERCLGLLDRFGPTGLAYLEALLRAADVRASRLNTLDPALRLESPV